MELLLFMPMLAAKPWGSAAPEPPPNVELLPKAGKSILCEPDAPTNNKNHQTLPDIMEPPCYGASSATQLPLKNGDRPFNCCGTCPFLASQALGQCSLKGRSKGLSCFPVPESLTLHI